MVRGGEKGSWRWWEKMLEAREALKGGVGGGRWWRWRMIPGFRAFYISNREKKEGSWNMRGFSVKNGFGSCWVVNGDRLSSFTF